MQTEDDLKNKKINHKGTKTQRKERIKYCNRSWGRKVKSS
jgi:hypothetical protein